MKTHCHRSGSLEGCPILTRISLLWWWIWCKCFETLQAPRNEKNFSQDEENGFHILQGPFHNSTHLALSPPIFNGACSIRHNSGGRWWPRSLLALIPTLHFFLWASTLFLTAYLVSYRRRRSWIFSYILNPLEGLLWASTVVSNGGYFEKEWSQVQRNYMQNQF